MKQPDIFIFTSVLCFVMLLSDCERLGEQRDDWADTDPNFVFQVKRKPLKVKSRL